MLYFEFNCLQQCLLIKSFQLKLMTQSNDSLDFIRELKSRPTAQGVNCLPQAERVRQVSADCRLDMLLMLHQSDGKHLVLPQEGAADQSSQNRPSGSIQTQVGRRQAATQQHITIISQGSVNTGLVMLF